MIWIRTVLYSPVHRTWYNVNYGVTNGSISRALQVTYGTESSPLIETSKRDKRQCGSSVAFSRQSGFRSLIYSLNAVRSSPTRDETDKLGVSRVHRAFLNVASRPSDLVGRTPLLDLSKILTSNGIDASLTKLYGKMESLGPCSSVKDRIGKYMIDDAERKGLIKAGETVLVEPTSGNTGIALAFIARERGYRCILTMPETMSIERRMMLLSLGCEVVLTPKETAVPGALAKALEILASLDGKGYMLQQFENPANPLAHRETTGPEIWNDTDGKIDIFVSGIGTGGTITGVSQYIKGKASVGCTEPKNPNLRTVAVEPREQMIVTEAKGFGPRLEPQGPHKIQGMGAGLLPKVLDLDMIDVVIPIHSDVAAEMTHQLWNIGVPVGISAGAIIAGAVEELKKPSSLGKVAVAIIPSFGERYFSHPMFEPIKEQATSLTKQPLPEPFDNTLYGFSTPRG